MFRFKFYIHDESGIASLEAALIFPFLALLCFGTMDASYLMLQNHKMESSLTAAGNYLAKTQDPKSHETEAKRLATTGQITTGGSALIKNWTETDVSVSYKKIANTALQDGMSYRGPDTIDIIQLTSNFKYEGLGLINNIMRGKLQVEASYEERIVGSQS